MKLMNAVRQRYVLYGLLLENGLARTGRHAHCKRQAHMDLPKIFPATVDAHIALCSKAENNTLKASLAHAIRKDAPSPKFSNPRKRRLQG